MPSAPAPAAGISDIVDAAAETKLLSRNPESFQSAVDAMAGDAGVSHVTMDGEGVAIAEIGRSGNASKVKYSHLHFEVRYGNAMPHLNGGTVVDPLLFLN
ncbi:MAG: hypothetical protein E6Q98_18745 [Rhodospirillaceae bacterium]|nr:MAG: hypothetical protein E6Q98_18745 [Rhodospirillaceae bacterium]